VLPDPRLLDAGPVDLAALENGGRITGVSNEFYGRPAQLIAPDLARSMGEGWETARRRDRGNDWVEIALACEGVATLAELDTSWFLGNAPGTAALTGIGRDGEVPLLPRTRLQPDTRHRFVLAGAPGVDRVRLDVFPDGGMARLRLWGRPTTAGRAALGRRWFDALPDVQALEVLGSIGVPPQVAGRLVGSRPLRGELPQEVARLIDGAVD
jgi:allantoicase